MPAALNNGWHCSKLIIDIYPRNFLVEVKYSRSELKLSLFPMP